MAKEDRGFASMDRAKQREIAQKGGRAAHQKGTAHQWAQPETIGRDGPHPLNMSGGNLGSGRVHGFGHVLETAMQLMGTAGVRQVKNNEVALCETGPFGSASSFTATRD